MVLRMENPAVQSHEQMHEMDDPYTRLLDDVEQAHPEYADEINLVRRAADLSKQADELMAQHVQAPISTYSAN